MKKNKFVLIVIITSVIMIISFLIYIKTSNNKNLINQVPLSNLNPKIYETRALKFSIELNNDAIVSEKDNSIIIQTKNGEIYIDSYGTNFDHIEDHVKFLSNKNNFSFRDQERLTINSYQAMKGYIDKELYYFIYPGDYTIYSLFVREPNLYNDLDKIAQSFTYTP